MREAHIQVNKASGRYPDCKFDKRKGEFDSFSEHSRERRVGGTRLDRRRRQTLWLVLDDIYMVTLMEEDVDKKSGSHNGLRSAKYRIPPCMRKKELWRHGRDQGPQRKRKAADNCTTNKSFL